jgi:hypothetical protein
MEVGRCIHSFGEGDREVKRQTLVLNLLVRLPQTSFMLPEMTVVTVTSEILFKKKRGGEGGFSEI